MKMMHHFFYLFVFCLSIESIHSQITFGSICSNEVQVSGLPSVDGNDEFEIELHEGKFLPDDVITGTRLLS